MAALRAVREGYGQAKPVVMEPIMKVEVRAPAEFQGAIVGQVNQRRGMIVETNTAEGHVTVVAEVPLNTMFGYSTDLRSGTQGKAEYSMEFSKYSAVPRAEQETMMKNFKDKNAAEAAARK
jgi:elongation factor G